MRLSELRRGTGEERTRRCRKHLACQPKIETEQSYGITTLGTFCGRYEKSRSLSWLSRQISPTETPNCDTFDQDNADTLRKNGVRGVGTIRFFEWRVRAGAEEGTAGRTTDQTTESKNKERVLEAFDTRFDNQVLGTFALYRPEPCVPTEADLALIEGAGAIARIAIERQRSQEVLRTALNDIEKLEAKRPTAAEQVPSEIVTKWQEIVNLLAEIMHVPAALVMQVEPPNIKVFVSSESVRNPYEHGELASLNSGLYCETVMKTRQPLLVPDALVDEEWKSNPDIKLGMISYLGFPISWPNGEVFGTICVLDDKKNDHSELHKKLLSQFRDLIQEDLRWLTDVAIHQIVDVIPVMIGVMKPDGTLLCVNKNVLDYTGLSIDDSVQLEAIDFLPGVHPGDIERLSEERRKAMLGNKPFAFEERIRREDGQYRWFLAQFNPLLDEQGRVVRWYATGTDIDDRVKAEERTRNENQALREQIDRDSMFEDIVGSSEVLRKVLRQVTKVALSDSTVLILGETGTGKELIARAIHKRSERASRAFIGVNCAAIPPSLIASELFGHEKGAFTGATQRRLGRFESASGGTLFLDEVGDLPLDIQIALLRVLQEREIRTRWR